MRSLQVIWAALVGTVVLYTLVAFWAMTSGIVAFSVFDSGIMPYVAGAALLLMLGGTVVRRVMVRRIDPEGDPNARLAAYMNASERSVVTYLKELEAAGYIEKKRIGAGRRTDYVLVTEHRYGA